MACGLRSAHVRRTTYAPGTVTRARDTNARPETLQRTPPGGLRRRSHRALAPAFGTLRLQPCKQALCLPGPPVVPAAPCRGLVERVGVRGHCDALVLNPSSLQRF